LDFEKRGILAKRGKARKAELLKKVETWLKESKK